MDELFCDALRDLLANHCTPGQVRAIEAGASAQALWSAIEGSGFADALAPEPAGGAGLGLRGAFPLIELCGRFALPVPLPETMLARAWLLDADQNPPQGSIAFAAVELQPDGSACAHAVGHGRVADHVLAWNGGAVRLLSASVAQRGASPFALDATLTFDAADWRAAHAFDAPLPARTAQALVYAGLLSGALMAVFEMTLRYANEREQFGKPIGKFQAVQHQLSVLAEQVFAARMAAQLAFDSSGQRADELRIAIAKARASEAAVEVASISHAIHGAIGFTEEFDLQLFTRRLHHWRQGAGAESFWHDVAGRALLAHEGMTLDLVRQVTAIA